MVDRLRERQGNTRGHVIGDRNICRDALAKPSSHECKQQVSRSVESAHSRFAAGNTFPVITSHEISGANVIARLVKEQAIGADSMVAVMLDDRWLAQKPCSRKRNQCRIR